MQLHDFALAQVGKPFVWGRMDCNTLAAQALDLATGSSVFDSIYGRYSSLRSALRFQCANPTPRTILDRAGAEIVTTPQDGDFLLSDIGGITACNICLGEFALSADIAKGIQLVPVSEIPYYQIWRLPSCHK